MVVDAVDLEPVSTSYFSESREKYRENPIYRRRMTRDAHAAIIVQNIDAFPPFLSGCYCCSESALLSDIGFEGHTFPSVLCYQRGRLFREFYIAIDCKDFGTFLGKAHNSCAAVPKSFARTLPCTNYYRDLIFQTHLLASCTNVADARRLPFAAPSSTVKFAMGSSHRFLTSR